MSADCKTQIIKSVIIYFLWKYPNKNGLNVKLTAFSAYSQTDVHFCITSVISNSLLLWVFAMEKEKHENQFSLI